MPLQTICFSSYLTRTIEHWTDDDYNASKFIKAIKGRSFNGYARVPVRGERRRLHPENASEAVDWFAQMARDELSDMGLYGSRIVLVPVPSHEATTESRPDRYPAFTLAEALWKELWNPETEPIIEDLLRWKTLKPASSAGGSRSPADLYDNLKVLAPPLMSDEWNYILIDDVTTGGGHLRAADAILSDHGIKTRLALCAGRTVQESPEDPFKVHREELPSFDPDERSFASLFGD